MFSAPTYQLFNTPIFMYLPFLWRVAYRMKNNDNKIRRISKNAGEISRFVNKVVPWANAVVVSILLNYQTDMCFFPQFNILRLRHLIWGTVIPNDSTQMTTPIAAWGDAMSGPMSRKVGIKRLWMRKAGTSVGRTDTHEQKLLTQLEFDVGYIMWKCYVTCVNLLHCGYPFVPLASTSVLCACTAHRWYRNPKRCCNISNGLWRGIVWPLCWAKGEG